MALGCAWALTEISRKSSTVGVLYAYSNYICEKWLLALYEDL
jgi:hypothetical protein